MESIDKFYPLCNYCNRKEAFLTYSADKVLSTKIISDNDIASFDKKLHFKLINGEILKVDFATHFGNWYLYKMNTTIFNASFCSRGCAIKYAEEKNILLINLQTNANNNSAEIIYPEQSYFDIYSKEKNITQSLIIGEKKHIQNINNEELINTNVDQIFSITKEAIEKGQYDRGYETTKKIINIDPYNIYNISLASILLLSLHKYQEIDDVFERIKNKYGHYNVFGAETLTSWAIMILPINKVKSLRLSKKAINKSPNLIEVIENHLAILQETSNEEGYKYLIKNQHKIKTEIGFFNAGIIYAKNGELDLARDNINIALMIHPTPETFKELAYINYLQSDYGNSLSNIKSGRKILESSESDNFQRGDGYESYYIAMDYEQKKYLLKAFLVLEGKIQFNIGEVTYGKRLLKDAIDIQIELCTEDPLFSDIKEYINDYKSKNELDKELIEFHKKYYNAVNHISSSQKKIDSLSALLDKIGETKTEWSEVLTHLKEEALCDEISENYINKLHSLSYYLKSYDQKQYEEVRRSVKKNFSNLPTDVLNFYANGIYLLRNLSNTLKLNEDIYACVVIEISKAVERALNDTIVKKYYAFMNCNTICNSFNTNNGRIKHLMFYELIQLFSSNENDWKLFIKKNYSDDQINFITSILPALLNQIKNKYRNGSAHYSSISKEKALEFINVLEKGEVFEKLNKL